MGWRLWLLLVLFLSWSVLGHVLSPQARAKHVQPPSRDAYVTLLYGGGFLLGARVLGQSLRETDTTRDLIALCTQEVSAVSKELLKADGWTVRTVQNIQNPYKGLSKVGSYFSGAFSKLHLWNMTDYDRIVYLDSDMLVVSNIDHLFNCGTFCAAYRRMDLFNAGVMMLIPSTEIFQEMLSMLPYTHSYDNGDQGFLNVYFKDLLYASMFNWSDNKQRKEKGHLRLPAGLNADISWYYLDGKWKIPEERLRVIHFTFLSVKPWMWWSNSLLDLNGQWNDVRSRLPQYEEAVSCSALCSSMYWLPYPFLALFFVALYLSECCSCAKFLVSEFEMFGSLNSRVYHFFPLSFLFVSYSLAFKIVPTTMMPSQAEYVFWLWSNFFLLTFISLYCYLCHIAAGLRANQQLVSSSSRKKLRTLTLYLVFTVSYVLVKAVPALVEPFWW